MSSSSKIDSHNLNMSELAQLSDTAYQTYGATKRQWVKNINPNLRVDSKLTNKHTTVVKDVRNNNVYVNFRGTKIDDPSDLSADLAILTGTENLHSRWKEADKHMNKVKDAYGDKANYILTGHSLGANISSHVARKHRLEAHLFNIGSSVGDVRKSISQKPSKQPKRKNEIIHYHTKDLISLGATLNGTFADRTIHVDCKNKKAINCHSIKNFI